jgi:CubicO group peptidase (beta-lactamase class C family)
LIKKLLCLLGLVTILSGFIGTTINAAQAEDISSLADKNGVHDYSVTVIDNGDVQTTSSRGEKVLTFEAGSISKPVTAYICLRLAEEGKLSLDDPVAKYLPDKWVTDDARMQSITIRQLLSHTAGFSPSYELGIDRKIYFEPGSHFSYSGVGYLYLQQAIETVYGGSLNEAAQEYVFNPLQMRDSTFGKAQTVTPYVKTSSLVLYVIAVWCIIAVAIFIVGLVIGLLMKFRLYKKRGLFYFSIIAGLIAAAVFIAVIIPRILIPELLFGGIGLIILWVTRKGKKASFLVFCGYIVVCAAIGLVVPATLPIGPELIPRPESAAYSLKTTSQDLSRFAEGLIELYHSDNGTMKEMFEPQIKIDQNNSWGAGLGIETIGDSVTFWHSGINPGMQSLFVIEPQDNKAVVIMTNSDNGLVFADKVAQNTLALNGKWEIGKPNLTE